ncbi:hypothetical protein [Microbacterium sp. NPDC056234]|uniref:hypothetical protein n=1 Tax=Microbacterium sp. NPDC056234 TaxID=3345757 RepID=UPI0035D7F9E3
MTQPRRPSDRVLEASGAELQHLSGGRGLAWRAENIVLRPSEADGEVQWKADVLARLDHSERFRAPRPVRAESGEWSFDRWEAWQWLPGAADETRVVDVLDTGNAFHAALSELERPAFVDVADDPWSRADRMAWQEEDLPTDPTLGQLAGAFAPIEAPSQIVHGDLLGNVLFERGAPATIIDWAPYWRPVGYASAIVLADAACWHDLPTAPLAALVRDMPEGAQMLLRALVFRIATLHLLGRWDDRMVQHHSPIVRTALALALP